jgi:hypothetical protein
VYYSSKIDFHKNTRQKPNNFNYIKNYYNSILKNNLNTVIFIDNSHDSFRQKYSNKNIFLRKTQLKVNNFLIHDVRFIEYYFYIKRHSEIDFFILSDISDVIILNDVQNKINIKKDKIYVGTEGSSIDNNIWFEEYLKYCSVYDSNLNKLLYEGKQILNCGVLCGSRNILLKFLKIFISYLYKIYENNYDSIHRPFDMYLTNLIIYKYFKNDIYKGDVLVTKFGNDEFDKSKCIKHK